MWDWFSKYPSVRIEDAATPLMKSLESKDIADFDYIIVGGMFAYPAARRNSGKWVNLRVL